MGHPLIFKGFTKRILNGSWNIIINRFTIVRTTTIRKYTIRPNNVPNGTKMLPWRNSALQRFVRGILQCVTTSNSQVKRRFLFVRTLHCKGHLIDQGIRFHIHFLLRHNGIMRGQQFLINFFPLGKFRNGLSNVFGPLRNNCNFKLLFPLHNQLNNRACFPTNNHHFRLPGLNKCRVLILRVTTTCRRRHKYLRPTRQRRTLPNNCTRHLNNICPCRPIHFTTKFNERMRIVMAFSQLRIVRPLASYLINGTTCPRTRG